MLANFGRPLTEALETTATVDGASHHVVVQPFWYGVVIVDSDAQDAKGQPKITLASAGADYLRTLGPPTVTLAAKTPAWGNATAALLDAPASGKPVATIGLNFPLTLTGETKWSKATLWYNASFSAAKRSGSGWAPAAALTLTAPDKAARAEAGLDMLSPDLAAFVASQNKNMGVALYDMTRNIYYGYNDTPTFTLASASKVAVMASYMDWVEGQNRALRSDEINTMAQMIEVSDNNAAQLLFERVGFGNGQKKFLQKLGITDYVPCGGGWGCAELSPASMTKLVTLLYQGKILTKEHQQLALTLMKSVVPGMRWGVGDTAPQGAIVYMKDGWLPLNQWTDWALNTTGVVVAGNETYVITVLSQHSDTEDWSKVNKVCGDVAKLLTS
jgi:Beta-lactamase enzyme family